MLLNDENRNGARHVRASLKIEDMHSPLVSMVSKILKEGVRAGPFRKGVNPVHLYISIAGLSYFFFSNTPTLSAIFGKDLSSTAARARPPQARGRPGDAGAAAVRSFVIPGRCESIEPGIARFRLRRHRGRAIVRIGGIASE